jgi:hypothetical protein
MKKKKLSKKLDLGKKEISNLGNVKGGALTVTNLTCDLFICTWYSELGTACNCEPSWYGGCESIATPCPRPSIQNCDY